jgi:tRNA threonylcarbamoyladenosine biosynthesis protein TsaE
MTNGDQAAPHRTVEFLLANLAATEVFGQRLGAVLFPGAVLALDGPLGAGKTHLARAIVVGLGGDPAQVSSPTFVLIQEYLARLPVYHADAYRLRSATEFSELGADEYFAAGGVSVIEWAERVRAVLPNERLDLFLAPLDEHRRQVRATAWGERYAELLAQIIAEHPTD